MTASFAPSSRDIGSALIGLAVLLTVGNWYLAPASVWRWTTALLFLAVIAFISWRAGRPVSAAHAHAVRQIQNGIICAALIMVGSLAVKMAYGLGVLHDTEVAQRMTMVVLGGFLVLTGNALPKTLTPLSQQRCDGARAQAMQRFIGWTWVIMGLVFAGAWLILPAGIARPVSMAVMAAAAIVIAAQIVRPKRNRYTEV